MPRTMKKGIKIIKDTTFESVNHSKNFIDILNKLEDIMTRKGEHIKARAYKKGQESLMEINEDLTSVEQLKNKPGIGKSIIEKFEEYLKTGTLSVLEKEKVNPVNILTNVYGIGPKKAEDLVKQGITSIEDLEKNKDKLNDKQVIGLKYYYDILERIPRSEILEYKALFKEIFDEVKEDDAKFEIVGSFRRGAETSGDIDIIVNNEASFNKFIKSLIDKNILVEMLTDGKVKKLTIARLNDKAKARRIDFLYSHPDEYSFAILYFTGSKAFNVVMRKRATSLNLTLNEHGISNMENKVKKDKLKNSFPDEKSIFEFLSLEYKKPEERKDGRDVIIKEEIKDIEETTGKKFIIKVNKTIKTKKGKKSLSKLIEAPAPPLDILEDSSKLIMEVPVPPPDILEDSPQLIIEASAPPPKLEAEVPKPDYMETIYKIDNKNKKRQWRVWIEKNNIYTEHGVVDGKLIKSKPTEVKDEETAIKKATKMWNDKQNKELYSIDVSKETKSDIFRPMLAKSFDKDKHNKYPYMCQPKLDGVRCVASKVDGNIILETRTGKKIEVLEHIKSMLNKIDFPENIKLDGELGSFGLNPELTFQQATGIIKRKTPDPLQKYVEYHLYDLYDEENKDTKFVERWEILNSLIPDNLSHIKLCDMKMVYDLNELEETHKTYVEEGYEGLIIRSQYGKYEPDHRSSSLLKLKSFKDDEFEIVGFKEGKGNDKNTIIFTCKIKNSSKTFEVRPRGTRDERTKMFDNGNSYIGKKITVKYFELTDEGIPRFPVGVVVRDYE